MKRTRNTTISRSKRERNGECCTQLADIENGVRHYHNRRMRKTTPTTETSFVYDGWNLVYECEAVGDVTNETFYCWGKDLSGTMQGAGGVGGLLYLKRNGTIYVPHCDAYGNVMRYTDTAGNVVAEYTYDTFGKTIAQSGLMAEVFRHRFSTKYFDSESGLYYYGYRFYSPALMRWLNRDPIEEDGGLNMYGFCGNNSMNKVDIVGMVEYNGKSDKKGFFYSFVVKKCEIAIIYGHGHKSFPHEISFEDDENSSAYFVGCWPDTTNKAIPDKNRLLDDLGPHRTVYDDETFKKLKELREHAMRRAKEICKTGCCRNGVWIRYQFSPSNRIGVRILDWLKGNSSRNKPAQLVGGGRWEGDIHVKCD